MCTCGSKYEKRLTVFLLHHHRHHHHDRDHLLLGHFHGIVLLRQLIINKRGGGGGGKENHYKCPVDIAVRNLDYPYNLHNCKPCALSMADFPPPAERPLEPADFGLNIGAFFNMSGSMRKRIMLPRMKTCSIWVTLPSLAVTVMPCI